MSRRRSTSRRTSMVVLPAFLIATGATRVFAGEKILYAGHYYERVESPLELTWVDAAEEARRKSHLGLPGHLATLTSADENAAISARVLKGLRDPTYRAWIGGYQPIGSPEPDGNWQWITGERFEYSNWDAFQPDDGFGDHEDALCIQGPNVPSEGRWSDLRADSLLRMYIVEYEAPLVQASPDDKIRWRDSVLDAPPPGGDMQAVRDQLGRIYVPLGSHPADGTARKEVIRFDESARDWQFIADLQTARTHAAVSIDHAGRLYAIGGRDQQGRLLRSVERYDPRTDEWTSISPLPEPRWAARAVADPGGEWIYVMGGRLGAGGTATRTAVRYAVESDEWLSVPSMSVPRVSFGATLGADGYVYAIGGSGGLDAGETGATVERLDPATNRWSTVAPLVSHPLEVGAAVADPCGFVYAIGGYERAATSAVERYLPSVDQWEPCPPLLRPRRRLAAALSQSGRIYAFGGEAGPGAAPGVEFTLACGPITVSRVWKVSVKFLLDQVGERVRGNLMTEADVRSQIDIANEILCSSGSQYTLELTELRDVPNETRWLAMDCVDGHRGLEAAARANPERFAWRTDAINVYIGRELFGCGGICSFPDSGSRIIVLSQRTAPTTLLHEVGHYFGLCHTHGCACGPCVVGEVGPCASEPGDDLVGDTLPDVACWTRQDMAFHSFGTDYESLGSDQAARIEDTFLNVMSYHPIDLQRARLTDEQIALMMDGARLRSRSIIGFVEDSPCDEQDFGDPEVVRGYFVRGDATADAVVQITDAVHTLSSLFAGGPASRCPDAADANDDGVINTSDPVFVLAVLFGGQQAVPRPGIEAGGLDPTPDELPACAWRPESCPETPAD